MSDSIIIDFEANNRELLATIDLLEKLGQIDKKSADQYRAATKAAKEHTTAVGSLTGKVNDLGNKAPIQHQKHTKAIRETKSEVERLEDRFRSLAERAIAAFAVERIIHFGEECVTAFAAAELASTRLSFAVTKVMGGTIESVAQLKEQSEGLSKATFFSPRQIQESQTLQAQFGLTADQIKKLTPSILNLAVAQGSDLATATTTATNAILGQTRGLRDVGADFHDTGDKVDNYNKLVDKLSKLNGTATDALNTTSGALKNQEKEMELLKEGIGEKLAPTLLLLKKVALETADAIADLFAGSNVEGDFKKRVEQATESLSKSKSSVTELEKERQESVKKTTDLIEKRNAMLAKNPRIASDIIDDEKKALHGLIGLSKEQEAYKKINAEINTEQAFQLGVVNVINKRNDATKESLKLADDLNSKFSKDVFGFSKEKLKQELDELKALPQTIDVQSLTTTRERALDVAIEKENNLRKKALRTRYEQGLQTKENEEKLNEDLLRSDIRQQNDLLKYTETTAQKRQEIAKNIDDLNNQIATKRFEFNKGQLKDDEKASIESVERSGKIQERVIKKRYADTGVFSKQADAQLKVELLNNEIRTNDEIVAQFKFNEDQKYAYAKKNADLLAQLEQAKVELNKENLEQDFQDTVAVQERIEQKSVAKIKLKYEGSTNPRDKLKEEDEIAAAHVLTLKTIDDETTLNKKKSLHEQEEAHKAYLNAIEDAETQHAARQKALDDDFKKRKKELVADITKTTIEGLYEIGAAQSQSDIQAINAQRDIQNKGVDEEIAVLEKKHSKKRISDAAYQKSLEKLQKEKEKNDKVALQKENAIKHQQDEANRDKRLFEIIIATARNVVENPLLIPFYLGLGAVEAGIVLATPLPKYHTGKQAKGVGKEHAAIVLDTETIFNPDDSKKYAPTFSAIFDKKVSHTALNDFVNLKIKGGDMKSNTVVVAPEFNYDKLASKLGSEIAYHFKTRDGVNIKNVKELAAALAPEIDPRVRK